MTPVTHTRSPPWWCPTLAGLFCSLHASRCCPRCGRKPECAPAWHLPHRQMTIQRRCGNPDAPADSIVGGTFLGSKDARLPAASLSINATQKSPYFEPSDSYAVCRKFSRCSTGEGNQCCQRGSPQPGYNSDEGNTRLVRRSPRPRSEFGEGNPRSQRCSPQPRHKFGDGGTRFKRRPPQPWQGSLRFTRRSPQPRVAQQGGCCDGASPS